MRRRVRLRGVGVSVSVAAAVLVPIVAVSWARDADRSSASASVPDDWEDVPGFGRSAEAAARDDLIAAWEEWRVESLVGACMAESGYGYSPDFVYSGDALESVVRVYAVNADPVAPVGLDARVVRDDGYYTALYGFVPNSDGTDTMARAEDDEIKGCLGDANESMSRVWDLPDLLTPEIDAIRRRAAQAPEVQAAYGDCVEKIAGERYGNPAAVERALMKSRPDKQAALDSALTQCASSRSEAIDSRADPALKELIGSQAALIETQVATYEALLPEIQASDAFASHLAWAVGQ